MGRLFIVAVVILSVILLELPHHVCERNLLPMNHEDDILEIA
jgi:hypothetical protein